MDSEGFIEEVEGRLIPVAPIIQFAIKKQLRDIGADRNNMTAEQAVVFIDKMAEALELLLGKGESREHRKVMISILRKYAPEYFEEHSLI